MYTIYVTTFSNEDQTTEVCSIIDKGLCDDMVNNLQKAIDVKTIYVCNGLTGEIISTVTP